MPEYDAFGREVDPDAERAATPSAQAEPATASPEPPPHAPRRRRTGLPVLTLVIALAVVVAGAALAFVTSGGGTSSTREDLRSTQDDLERSTEEFEEAIERSAGDPDAPSPLTAEGAEAAIATLREEADDPRAVAFEAARTIAILPPSKPNGVPAVFTWALNRGSDSPNGFRSDKPEYVKLKPFDWDDVDPAAMERVVAAAGGEDAVDQVAIQIEDGELGWTAYLPGGAERRFDPRGRPVSP